MDRLYIVVGKYKWDCGLQPGKERLVRKYLGMDLRIFDWCKLC